MFKNYCSKGKTVIAILFSATIGVILGILFAPKSGKETRNQINGKTEAIREEINYKTHELKERVVEKAERVQEDISEIKEDIKEKVIETAEKVQVEILSKTDDIKEKVKEKVTALKPNKEEDLDEGFFEDVILDTFDAEDEADGNVMKEADEVVILDSPTIEADKLDSNPQVKPKRPRKKTQTSNENTDSTDNI